MRATMRILPSAAALAAIDPPDLIVALGCPPQTRSGRPSRFLTGRALAAAAAHHALGGRPILCSGRGHPNAPGAEIEAGGDEVGALTALLVAARVPPQALLFDREALRTIDSIDHLARRFADRRLLLVSQAFHLPRVLFLARARGLDAWGLVANGPPLGWRGQLREDFGRLRAIWDVGIARRAHGRRSDRNR
ncbi:MAG: ElyC/SanA/YdcF family protein [Myxococcota bacterium]